MLKAGIAIAAVLSFGVWTVARDSQATVHFFDVGQGDAALVDDGHGTQVLVDGGPDRAVLRGLGKAMPRFDRRIELVVLSHPHLDHYGGLIDVVARYDVGTVLVNQPGDGAYERLIEEASSNGRIVAAAGQRIGMRDGVVEVLEPASDQRRRYANANDASIVIRVTLHGRSFLFPGDAEEAEERRLLGRPALDAEVLKVPHHGSRTSSTDEFIREVSPAWCIVSSGKDNRYGHPDPDTMRRLAEARCQTVRTDRRGTITATVSNLGIRFSTER